MMEKHRLGRVPTPTFPGSAPRQDSSPSRLGCHFACGAKVFPQMGAQLGGRGNDSPEGCGTAFGTRAFGSPVKA